MKSQILLDSYANASDIEGDFFVELHNNSRPHESLQNLALADVCVGCAQETLDRRAERKRLTM